MKNLKNSATTINIFLLLLFYIELYKDFFFLGKHSLLENLVRASSYYSSFGLKTI